MIRYAAILCATLTATVVVAADPPTPIAAAYWNAGELRASKIRDRITREIDAIQNQLQSPGPEIARLAPKQRAKWIAEQNVKLTKKQRMAAETWVMPLIELPQASSGSVGLVRLGQRDASKADLSAPTPVRAIEAGSQAAYQFLAQQQVASQAERTEFLSSDPDTIRVAWATGDGFVGHYGGYSVLFKDFVDNPAANQTVTLDAIAIVEEPTAGMITVRALTPDEMQAADALVAQKRWESHPFIRLFSDASGQFQTKAEFLRLNGSLVELKKQDGSLLEVPLSKLSRDDRQWILEHKE